MSKEQTLACLTLETCPCWTTDNGIPRTVENARAIIEKDFEDHERLADPEFQADWLIDILTDLLKRRIELEQEADTTETPVEPADPEPTEKPVEAPKKKKKHKKTKKQIEAEKQAERDAKREANKKLSPEERQTRSPPKENCCQSRIWCGQPDKRVAGQVSYPNVRCKNKTHDDQEKYCSKCNKTLLDKPQNHCGNIFEPPAPYQVYQGKKLWWYGTAVDKNTQKLVCMPIPHQKHSNRFFMGRDQLAWFDSVCEKVGFDEEAEASNLFEGTNLLHGKIDKENGKGLAGFTM